MVVETCVDERSFGGLVRHELRWLRTIRAVRPLGYGLSFVTFSVPVAWLGCAISRGAWPAIVLLAVTALGRIVLHLRVRAAVAGHRTRFRPVALEGGAQPVALGLGIRDPSSALARRPLPRDPRRLGAAGGENHPMTTAACSA